MQTSNLGDKVSILIPTKNRPQFLERLLRFLSAQNFAGSVLIGDSSGDEFLAETIRSVSYYRDRVKIRHERYPQFGVLGTLGSLCGYIQTPYSCVLADDDFLCVRGLRDCVAFLEGHSEFGAAHGMGVNIGLDRFDFRGRITAINPFPLFTTTKETGAERLEELFNTPGNVLFCLHRSEIFREMLQGFCAMGEIKSGFIFDELIPSTISVIRNKIKALDCLYLVRHVHPTPYRHMPINSWLHDPGWFPAYVIFRAQVIKALVSQDNISFEEAERIFYKVFMSYLFREICSQDRKESQGKRIALKARVKTVAYQLPLLKKLHMFYRCRHVAGSNADLLRSTSPYYQDFKCIVDALS